MKKYIVTYVDYENGRASNPFAFHQTFNTKEEARQAIVDDLESITESEYKLNEKSDGTLKAELNETYQAEEIIYNIQPVEV